MSDVENVKREMSKIINKKMEEFLVAGDDPAKAVQEKYAKRFSEYLFSQRHGRAIGLYFAQEAGEGLVESYIHAATRIIGEVKKWQIVTEYLEKTQGTVTVDGRMAVEANSELIDAIMEEMEHFASTSAEMEGVLQELMVFVDMMFASINPDATAEELIEAIKEA